MSDGKKTIVISAVNLRKGGTLTILRDCLQYLSNLAHEYRIVAIVHKSELCDYEGIEYIEMPDVIKGWGKRLWCEYVTMRKISEELSPVYLWLSLHDTSPRVKAERQFIARRRSRSIDGAFATSGWISRSRCLRCLPSMLTR